MEEYFYLIIEQMHEKLFKAEKDKIMKHENFCMNIYVKIICRLCNSKAKKT